LRPNRNWIFGENNKVYNYEVFDPDAQFFGGLNVYELDPASFALKRRVHAERAVWTPGKNSWSLESGWVRDFDGDQITRFVPFDKFDLAELSEPPSYFNREVRQYYQMDWWQLAEYIRELRQAGFDVGRLTVQWQKKLAFPMIAPVITLLAIPFALLVGTRGAIGGVALGVGIAIVYWATSSLFEALGGVGQLPPIMAAWAPDAIFAFLAAYFFLRMPT
jgi:lipopolysaccharide export LptBFGC system permease protein LptF